MRKIILLFLLAGVATANEAKFVFSVTDEEGVPIENAHVIVGFDMPRGDGRGSIERQLKVVTDEEGKATFQGETSDLVWVSVKKSGYYKSLIKSVKITGKDDAEEKWLPWGNQYEVELRKIGERSEVCSKRVYWEFVPLFNNKSYYDFSKGTWDSSNGMCLKVIDRSQGWDVYLCLEGEHNGISEALQVSEQSIFRLQRNAPDAGYVNQVCIASSLSRSSIQDGKKQYFFRLNTKVDDNGEVVSAEYGKLVEGISCERTKDNNLKVKFGFVFNPEGNNLEFDADFNRLSGLAPEQMLNSP